MTRACRPLLLWYCCSLLCGRRQRTSAQPHSIAPCRAISWRVENPFRFFTDPADTEVHRATYRALRPRTAHRRCWPPSRRCSAATTTAGPRRCSARPAGTTQTTASSARTATTTSIRSHRVDRQVAGIDDAAKLDLHVADGAARGEALRGEAVTQPCSERRGFEIPYPDGARSTVEIGGREVASIDSQGRAICSIVGMGDSFASGEGNPDVPVRFSRERAADYGKRVERQDLLAAIRRASAPGADRRQGLHRGERALDRPGLPPLALFASVARRPAARASRTRIAPSRSSAWPARARRSRSGCSCATRATSGCPTRRTCRRSPPSRRRSAASTRRRCQDLPEAYHMNGTIPELKGGLVLRKCEPEQCAQDRSRAPVGRRQRCRLLAPARQRRARRQVAAAAARRLVRRRCTGWTRRACSSTR